MRKILTTVLATTMVAALATITPAGATSLGVPDPTNLTAHVVTTFDPGDGGAFAESLAAKGDGSLIASVNQWGAEQPDGTWADNTGQLFRVRRDGTTTEFGPAIPLGGCAMILGVTVDPSGRALVAVYNYGPDPSCVTYSPPSGVLRVTWGSVTRLMTLPAGSWPNGVTTHAGKVYVTDSASGVVWRGSLWRASSPTKPWFKSWQLTSPDPERPLGANGIAYRNGGLFVTSYIRGLILRIGIGDDGTASGSRVLAKDELLVEADGIAFDAIGRAWVTVNGGGDGSGSIVVVSPHGYVKAAGTPVGSLDYPTQAVIDCHGTVYVSNGSYWYGTPNVVALTR